MYPTLFDHDYLVLESNFLYPDGPKQGDIVVIVPAAAGRSWTSSIVKRVIATGGQTVDIDFDRGIVYVDGRSAGRERIPSSRPTAAICEIGEALDYPVTVPDGKRLCAWATTATTPPTAAMPRVGCVERVAVLGRVLLRDLSPARQTNEEGAVDRRAADFRRYRRGIMNHGSSKQHTMNIQWYPGHMTKTRRMMEEDLKLRRRSVRNS